MMSCDIVQPPFTEEQKGQICGMLSIGCDRQTAANVLGSLPGDVRRLMQHDAAFAESVRRAEGGAELFHMRNVYEAAKDAKNWRTSVWWLERHSPERFGSRAAGVVTATHLKVFVAILVNSLTEDVRDSEDRDRVVARIQTLADSVDRLIREQSASEPMAFDPPPASLPDWNEAEVFESSTDESASASECS